MSCREACRNNFLFVSVVCVFSLWFAFAFACRSTAPFRRKGGGKLQCQGRIGYIDCEDGLKNVCSMLWWVHVAAASEGGRRERRVRDVECWVRGGERRSRGRVLCVPFRSATGRHSTHTVNVSRASLFVRCEVGPLAQKRGWRSEQQRSTKKGERVACKVE